MNGVKTFKSPCGRLRRQCAGTASGASRRGNDGGVQRELFPAVSKLKAARLETPSLIVSDANKGLIAAIRESFPSASRHRCKVHFMRNILSHVPQKENGTFAAQLKEIRLVPSAELARLRVNQLSERYGKRFPKALEILEEGLEYSLAFYAFLKLDACKISYAGAAQHGNWTQNERRWNLS